MNDFLHVSTSHLYGRIFKWKFMCSSSDRLPRNFRSKIKRRKSNFPVYDLIASVTFTTQFALIKFDFARGRIVMEHVLLVAILILGIEWFATYWTESWFSSFFSSLSADWWVRRMGILDVWLQTETVQWSENLCSSLPRYRFNYNFDDVNAAPQSKHSKSLRSAEFFNFNLLRFDSILHCRFKPDFNFVSLTGASSLHATSLIGFAASRVGNLFASVDWMKSWWMTGKRPSFLHTSFIVPFFNPHFHLLMSNLLRFIFHVTVGHVIVPSVWMVGTDVNF